MLFLKIMKLCKDKRTFNNKFDFSGFLIIKPNFEAKMSTFWWVQPKNLWRDLRLQVTGVSSVSQNLCLPHCRGLLNKTIVLAQNFLGRRHWISRTLEILSTSSNDHHVFLLDLHSSLSSLRSACVCKDNFHWPVLFKR